MERQTMQPAVSQLRSIHVTAWTVAGAFVFALVGPWLLAKGIFWDGALYATISRNLAVGIGDLWHPSVTGTFMHRFREHPPLAIWSQALFFRAVGDHFWVERVYSLITALCTLSILSGIWRRLLRDTPGASEFSWLAVILWAPFGTWCYRHNMLENTMGFFTVLSIHASLRSQDSTRTATAWSALAGMAIAAAVLSKGPVGLFPAVTPAIAWFALRRTSFAQAAWIELVVAASFAAVIAMVLIPAACREYLVAYWHQQVVSSMLGHRERIGSWVGQFDIMVLIINELRIPILVTGAVVLASRIASGVRLRDPRLRGPMLFCLLTALSASLPLVASPKQAEHYAAPSWPFYIFAVVVCCQPAARDLTSRIARLKRPRMHRALRFGTYGIVAVTAAISVLNYGRCARDESLIRSADQLASGIPAQSTLLVSSESWNQMDPGDQLKLHVYLYRYHEISIFVDEPRPVFDLEIHRLERPDPTMVIAAVPIQIESGLVAHRLVRRENSNIAAIPGLLR